MNKNFETVITEIEALDREFRVNGIPERYKQKWHMEVNFGLWIVGRETAEFLYKLVLREKPRKILELGTSVGYSALWLGHAAQTYGGKVITVEREKCKFYEAREFIRRTGFENIECVNTEICEFLSIKQPRANFIFIDAGKREYLYYLKLLEPNLESGAIIVADNIADFAEQTAPYTEYISRNPHYKSELIDIDDGLLVSRYRK